MSERAAPTKLLCFSPSQGAPMLSTALPIPPSDAVPHHEITCQGRILQFPWVARQALGKSFLLHEHEKEAFSQLDFFV